MKNDIEKSRKVKEVIDLILERKELFPEFNLEVKVFRDGKELHPS